jgi:hypothetical protein
LVFHDFFGFLSNFATGLTLDVPAFTFSMAARASRFRSTVLVYRTIFVEAPDRERAEAVAIKEFGLDQDQRSRLLIRERA